MLERERERVKHFHFVNPKLKATTKCGYYKAWKLVLYELFFNTFLP